MVMNCGVGEDSWESLGLQGDATSPHLGRSVLSVHWKDWWWSWNSNTLATWWEESTHWKRPCCWERLKAGGEGDDRGWDGWMASPAWWTWVSASPGSWWWTGRPGMLQSMGSQRVWYNWVIELTDVAVVWSLSHVWLFVASWTIACQVPLSMGFPRQEHWSGLTFPSPGDFLTQGSNLNLLIGRQICYHWATRGSQGLIFN